MSSPAQRVVEGAEIPSVPHVLQEILRVASDPESSSRDLEELILKEPGMVTHLLKTANSAFFAFAQKVTSVNHAIVLLGFSTVRSIASGLALIDAFHNLPGLNRAYVLEVWKHALASAGLARMFASRGLRQAQNDLFLSSMVHNVGHLVLAQAHAADYDALLEEGLYPPVERERERFDVDHAEVGAYLLGTWKFPPEICERIAAHHDAGRFRGDEREILCMQVSDRIAREGEGLGDLLDRPEADVEESLLRQLGQVGWRWEEVQADKDTLVESTRLMQQVILAGS